MESIPETWKRLQDYIQPCPHHGMENWLVLQNFYEGLCPYRRGTWMPLLEAHFFPLPSMMPRLSSKRWWPVKAGEERKQQKGMHTVKEVDMLTIKMDLLMKRLDERAHKKEVMKTTV
jgi:hypothetical protein